MYRFKQLMVILLLFCMSPAAAQESTFTVPEPIFVNIDSLIADSVKKAFILNHRPIDSAELNSIEIIKSKCFYGRYVSNYVQKNGFYKAMVVSSRPYISKRNPPKMEWIFYSFYLLFLFLALINSFFSSYLKNVFRVFLNEGFIYRQAKDQMAQSPFASFVMNLLFVLSATFYIYFGAGGKNIFIGIDRWLTMTYILLLLVVVYILKYIFFELIGWIFKMKESFESYIFIVFLNNKISGILMLTTSFIMAFSDSSSIPFVFNLSLCFLAIIILIRFFRGFQVFSKQAHLGFFNFLFLIVSLEILPSAIILKFISASFDLTWGATFNEGFC